MREPDGGRAGHTPETLVTSGWRRGAMPIVGSIVAGLILGTVATLTFVTRAVDRSASANEPLRLDIFADGIVPNVDRLKRVLTISPDGRYVVFGGRGEDQVSRLYKRDLRDGATARIPGVESGGLPFFSPDSEWLGFITGTSGGATSGGKVWKVPVGGGAPEDLADVNNSFGGAWGPDGNIVYAWDASGGLHEVPTSGGGSELLTERGSFWNPSFLPDGKSLLAAQALGGKGDFDIILVDLETGERQSLGEVGVAPQYLPSGHIIFGRERDLYAARFDLDSRQILGDPVPVVRGIGDGNTAPRQFAVSEGGILVYIQQGEAQLGEIVKVDMEGNAEPYGIQPHLYRYPRVSPDGTKVSVTVEEIHDADVWIVELLDGSVRRLTDEYRNQLQIWSADGASVIYEQTDDDGLRHIYRRPADGSGAAEHVYSPAEHGHQRFGLNSVSADGSILVGSGNPDDEGPPVGLAYVSVENPSEMSLFVVRREESGARLHTARISPDGERVAYVSNETGRSKVYVTTFPDPGPNLMVSSDATPGDAGYPMWAPDGSGVFYTQSDRSGVGISGAGGKQMWFAELDADPAARPIANRALFDTSGYRASGNFVMSNFDIFPEGQSFLMLRDVSDEPAPPQMKGIVNFFEMLERLLPAPGVQRR